MNLKTQSEDLKNILSETFDTFDHAVKQYEGRLAVEDVGRVTYLGAGIARITGLKGVRANELIRFPGNLMGIAFNVDPHEVGVVLLDEYENISAGSEVRRTDRVLDVPVGEGLLGRMVDGLGRPMDGQGNYKSSQRLPIERDAAGIMDRLPVTEPLQTGFKVLDALIPIGRGQRELIVGDRQTGKSAIAIDTIINQGDKDVLCIYCAVGKRSSSVAKVVSDLKQYNAMDHSIIVVATEEDPPGLQFITPYAATAMAEYFVEQGKDVLVVFDDLTRHARAYRELSLLLRRPPGREAFPGDIFYIHSRLLERFTHLKEELGGGSLTALPIIETEAQNISAYIPTNLISITDGQIYLSPDLFQKGILPAVDVGKSVSRVGGKTQLSAYRSVAGDLRLSYSQFEELESFSRFGTQLDEDTKKRLNRGRRVREILKQPQYQPIPVAEQIASLVAANEGIFDRFELDKVSEAEKKIQASVCDRIPEICEKIGKGEKLSDKNIHTIEQTIREILNLKESENTDGNA